jgi:hypothetical protein
MKIQSHRTKPAPISAEFIMHYRSSNSTSAIGIATDNEKSPMRRIYWYILRSPLEEVHLV